MVYFLKGLSISDVKIGKFRLVPLWRHLYGQLKMTGDQILRFQIFKGELTMIAYAKLNGILSVGYILNRF